MTAAKSASHTIVRTRPEFRWPGGRHVAVIFNIAYEAWSDGKAPGIGPMGNPLPAGAFDTNALSWGNYGATHGIERMLRVLDRTKTRASIMVSGILAERVPEQLEAGIVGVNDPLPSVAFAPMGGAKQSGLGREGASLGLEEFEEVQYVAWRP